MKKIVLVPDSFKGSLTSQEICTIMRERILAWDATAKVTAIPVADGGEGSVDAFLTAVGGEKISLSVKGPYMEDVTGFYGLINNGKTAVIEMAAAAGLPLVGSNLHAEKTTTYGVGQLMAAAATRGVTKIILGLGGSCTNDFGVGAAAACGVKFYRDDGSTFIPRGGSLQEIHHIDTRELLSDLRKVEIVVMCDIDNPLYGENGAAYIFAPQKGADTAMVEFLDGQLRHISAVVKQDLGVDVADLPGAGAAGGMGGGMVAFFGAPLKMGIDVILEAVEFSNLLKDADLVITGEGRLDGQSLRGKVVSGVARSATKQNIPVVAVVGAVEPGIDVLAYKQGITAIFPTTRALLDWESAKRISKENLASTMDNIMRLLLLSIY